MSKGLSAVRNAIGGALRDVARQQRRRNDPPPSLPRGEGENARLAGKWTPNNLGLPTEDPCPVVPLGIEGEMYHVIDSAGQFRSVTASDMSHAGIQGLFGALPNYPQWAWPRYGRAAKAAEGEQPKAPPIKSFEDDAVRCALILACNRKGLFSPSERMRGRGAWTLRGGQLIYHAGEDLWMVDGGRMKVFDTGMVSGERHLYPRMAPLPAPWSEPIKPADNPARELLQTFRKWNWERPEVDPILLLGWIGCAYLGGALDWRSHILLLGDKGTGKSTLQDGLKEVFGEALFHSADTTAAGIYQKMAHDARPVAVDELEASADQRKVDAVVTLMRAASSGAFARRGSSGHEPVEFQMRSAFLFSAINNPINATQDLSRLAILRLKPLDHDQPPPPPINADTAGPMTLARLMHEWPRFAPALEAYQTALRAGGHDARGQKTYGTLLACADLMLGPELAGELGVPMVDDLSFWSEHLAATALPEIEDAKPTWRNVVDHMMQSQVQQWRNGTRQTVGALMEALVENKIDFGTARQDLAMTGLGLLRAESFAMPAEAGYGLCIPNQSPLVAQLFQGTVYQGQPGQPGPWKDALRYAPDGVCVTSKVHNRVSINGVQQRCTILMWNAYQAAPER